MEEVEEQNSSSEPINKYANAKDKNSCEGFIKLQNSIFNYPKLDGKDIGLLVAIKTQLTNMKYNNMTFTTMTSINVLIVSLGLTFTRANYNNIEKSLSNLIDVGLVKKTNVKTIGKEQCFQLALEEPESNFTMIDMQSIYTIIGKSEKINVLTRLSVFATILSYIYHGQNSATDGVCIKSTSEMIERSRVSRSRFNETTHLLCEWNILAYYLVKGRTAQAFRKRVYSTFENRNKLVLHVKTKMKSGTYIEIIE